MKNWKFFILPILLFLSSCEKSEVIERDDVGNIDQEVRFLRDNGFMSPKFYESQKRKSDFLINWDGDEAYRLEEPANCNAMMQRATVQEMMANAEVALQGRHRRYTYMFTGSGGTISISVKMTGSAGVPSNRVVPAVWQTAINQAAAAWNALPYKVKFSVVCAADNSYPTNVINVDYGDTGQGSTNIATTYYPGAAGGFGYRMRINSGYGGTALTTSARKFAVAHELGHAIGVAHTDTGDWSAVASTISCYGSTSYVDPSSVFKASIPYNQSWNGFTSCDQTLIDYYW